MINFAVPALNEPYYLVRPEYGDSDSPTSFESVNADEILSDCTSVNYVIEDDEGNVESEKASSKESPVRIAISSVAENKKK